MKKILAGFMFTVLLFPSVSSLHAQTASTSQFSPEWIAKVEHQIQLLQDLLNLVLLLQGQVQTQTQVQNQIQAQQVQQSGAINQVVQQQKIIMDQTQPQATPATPTVSVGSSFCEAGKMYLPTTISGVFTSLNVQIDSSGGTGNGGGVHGGQVFQSSNPGKSVDDIFNVELGLASKLDPANNGYRLIEENPYLNGSTFAYTVSVKDSSNQEVAQASGPISFPSCN